MNNRNKSLLEEFEYYLKTSVTSKGFKRADNTVRASYDDTKDFLNFIDNLDATKVTLNDANKWIESLGLSVASRNRKRSSLRSFYNSLVVNNIIENNPVTQLRPERITKGKDCKVRDWFEVDEIKKFKNVLEREVICVKPKKGSRIENVEMNVLRWRAMLSLMLETGVRVGEAISLERTELKHDPNKGYFITILSEKSKNREERKIPLPAYVVDYIKEYRNSLTFVPDNQYIFLSQNGNKLDEKIVLLKVKEYTELANIDKHITPHSLRHTFASYKLNVENISSTVVAKWMGHNSKVLEEIYYHQDELDGECVI